MARLPRLTIPGHPHQIVQRGNNSQPICLGPADFTTLLDAIDGQAQKFKVAVHSYVIVESHFQLLATPETEMGLSQMMQAIGRSYVRYFNQSHGRSGTLWEGRYKSTVIQADRYLLPCMVYMDLLPVRQGTVPSPSDYPWSSHGHYSGRLVDRKLRTPNWCDQEFPGLKNRCLRRRTPAGGCSAERILLLICKRIQRGASQRDCPGALQ